MVNNLLNECWRDIPGYEGLYRVSNMGRVKHLPIKTKNQYSISEHIVATFKRRNYLGIYLYKNGIGKKFSMQRLVATAFPEICGEWFEGAVVNHKNEDKTDNRAENLEWCTQKYNANYGTRNKRISNNKTNGSTSKPILQFDLDGNLIKEWPSLREIERVLNIVHSNIAFCCNGKYKQSHNFIWRYKEAS